MEKNGVPPEHGSLSFFPWEHIDAYSGNVMLSFSDLVLPGNAGFNLTVTRTYNAKDKTWRWAVGPNVFDNDPAYPPGLMTPDGVDQSMLWRADNEYWTPSFWRYTRSAVVEERKLETPKWDRMSLLRRRPPQIDAGYLR